MKQSGYSYPPQPPQQPGSSPADPWAQTQPAPTAYQAYRPSPRSGRRRPTTRGGGCCSVLGCAPWILAAVFVSILLAIYLLAPLRTNLLILGIDYAPGKSPLSRTDTVMLTTVVPLKPYVGILSIPRDLWVTIPDVGENRINTAHFFAEGLEAGSGPYAVLRTIQSNFGVDVSYYMRINFKGFKEVVDALGGVDVDMPEPMAGYPAGRHHLTGNKALAFVRNRTGTDDFFRMEHGQLLIKAIFRQLMNPLKWWRLPAVVQALVRATDTNLPFWHWPRFGLAFLRAGPDGIDSRTITREMVTPFTTSAGASVLLPNWERINPTLMEIFGQ